MYRLRESQMDIEFSRSANQRLFQHHTGKQRFLGEIVDDAVWPMHSSSFSVNRSHHVPASYSSTGTAMAKNNHV